MDRQINCIVVDDEAIAREILEDYLSRIPGVKLVASCKSALDAFQIITGTEVNLVFLDINMPGLSGLSFARAVSRDIKVTFTTAYREYAVDGFDLQAVDYLLKPISFERLLQSIRKYVSELGPPSDANAKEETDDNGEYLFVRADRKMVRIDFRELLYIESIGDYLQFHMKTGKVVSRETMTTIEAKLPQSDFIRIHRSFIVAKRAINCYTTELVEVNKVELPIGRSYKEQVMKVLETG